MRVQANPKRADRSSCASGTGTSGPAGSSRYGFALRLISPNERRTVSASSRPVDDLVLGDVVEQDVTPSTLTKPRAGIGRQRHLAVAALDRSGRARRPRTGPRRPSRRPAAGVGRANRTRWSRDRFSNATRTRTNGSPARSSRSVVTSVGPWSRRGAGASGSRPRRPVVASPDDRSCRGAARPRSPATLDLERASRRSCRRPAVRSCSCRRTRRRRRSARPRAASTPPPVSRNVPSSPTSTVTSPLRGRGPSRRPGARSARRGCRRVRVSTTCDQPSGGSRDPRQEPAAVRRPDDEVPRSSRALGRGGARPRRSAPRRRAPAGRPTSSTRTVIRGRSPSVRARCSRR